MSGKTLEVVVPEAHYALHLGNPQHACAARVTVLGLCVCVSVCLSVSSNLTSRTITRPTGNTNGFSVTWAAKRRRFLYKCFVK